jgi:hypothetical protein
MNKKTDLKQFFQWEWGMALYGAKNGLTSFNNGKSWRGNSEKSQILKMSSKNAKMAINVPNNLHGALTNLQNITTIYKLL